MSPLNLLSGDGIGVETSASELFQVVKQVSVVGLGCSYAL